MVRTGLLSLTLLLFVVASANAAVEVFHTVTFSDPPSVGSGHTPGVGGRLVSTSQNFREDGVHVEACTLGQLSRALGIPRPGEGRKYLLRLAWQPFYAQLESGRATVE